MTAYDFNRTMLALLGAIVFLGLIMEYTSLLFAPQVLKTPGFALPSSAGAPAAATPAAAPKETPLPELLAKADAKKGRGRRQDLRAPVTTSTRAAPPRSVRTSGASSDGPSRRRRASPIPTLVKALGGDWDYEKLNHWIGDPKAMAAGTKMAFAGEKEPQKRADILAYLQSLSDSPVPFPK